MPVTLPGLSVTKAAELLQTQNRIIKSFPEVDSVFGKAGRAATATDPAPTEMVETVINLKPEAEWRPGVTVNSLIAEMDRSLQFPGVSNAWTMPIKARIDMLSTGIRTPVGVKVFGTDLRRSTGSAAKSSASCARCRARRAPILGARHRRVLPRDDPRSRAACPLWADDGRGAGRHRHGARRGADHHHRRGPRALCGQSAAAARLPQRSPVDCAAMSLCRRRPAHAIPLGRTGGHQAHQRPIRRSAPRMLSLLPISSSMYATAISAAMSPMQNVRWQRSRVSARLLCCPGAASTNIWNEPRRGSRLSYRLRFWSSSCCCT